MQLTYNAIKAGAVGVDMGRNIWQSDNPVPMIRAVRSIVHGNATVDQAFKLYTQLCGENKSKNPNQNKSKNPNQNKSKNPNQNQTKTLDNKK